MMDTYKARARKEDLVRSLARSGNNISIKKQRITTRLSKIAQRRISLPEWPSSMESLRFDQEDIIGSAYSIIEFEPLHNFHEGI